jgi:N-acetylglucosamine kinase-like BadF-type ATPase
VLGVDGGNTKSDYVLCAPDGRVIASLRAGTCSHEKLGMDGAAREMEARIHQLTSRANVDRGEIGTAVFGLAGIDQPEQERAMHEIVSGYGIADCLAVNDAFLGVKAGSPDGIGVGSVNGTGTSSAGIDRQGRRLQVGGLGFISGDDAGGGYLAASVLRAVYASAFQFAPSTSMTKPVFDLFDISDERDLPLAYSALYQYGTAVNDAQLVQVALAASNAGDGAARSIVEHIGEVLGVSAAGCAARLDLPSPVPVSLIGSVWSRGQHEPMIDAFRRAFTRYAGACTLSIVDDPPVAGAALWALERATERVPDEAQRRNLLQSLRNTPPERANN